MPNVNELQIVNELFNANLKVFGLEALLNVMPIPPARQLTAGGASLDVSTPKVANGECLLIAKVTVDRVAGDHFTKLRSILRRSVVHDSIHREVEVRPERLRLLEQHKYRPAGPHVMVSIDVQTDAGCQLAQATACSGFRLQGLKNTKWATTAPPRN
jgi:hypothetical protein